MIVHFAKSSSGNEDSARHLSEPRHLRHSPSHGGGKHIALAPAGDERRPRLHRALRVVLFAIPSLLASLCIIVALTEVWLFKTWAALDIDEIIYHLKVSLEGTNLDMIVEYLATYGIAELVVLAALFWSLWVVRKRRRVFAGLAASYFALSVLALGLALHDFDSRTGLSAYLSNEASASEGDDGDFVGEHYVDPASVGIRFPEQRRNLVYIFLESMEMTYADEASGGAFERNCIPELTLLARGGGEDFSGGDATLNGAISLQGTTWTSGGMFAQTSGLPLKVAVDNEALRNEKEFFPQIQTIGDVLGGAGYHQVLLIGSEAEFGGRRALFGTHGGFEIHDYGYASATGKIPEGYRVWWGFEDERLFAFAREELLGLSAAGEPFNLTMLTADTHFEDGFVCGLCTNEYDDQYANVFACSSRQVASFVAWMREQDFWDNTTVVICGDHPTMDSDFCAGVPDDYQRRVLTTVINAATSPTKPTRRRTYSTMDLFPTTLAALGAQIDGDRLGLGTNLFSARSTLIEELGLDEVNENLRRRSNFLDTYAGISVSIQDMELDARSAILSAWPAPGPSTYVTLRDSTRVNREFVRVARLEATDLRTGVVTSYNMSVKPSGEDVALLQDSSYYARIPLDASELSHYRLEAFFWVDGVEHYAMASRTSPDHSPAPVGASGWVGGSGDVEGGSYLRLALAHLVPTPDAWANPGEG